MELFAVAREGRAVPAACLPRDGVGGRVLLLVVQSGYVKLEAEKRADATESFDKLTSFLRSIGNEFESCSITSVIVREPFRKGHVIDHRKLFAGIIAIKRRGFCRILRVGNMLLCGTLGPVVSERGVPPAGSTNFQRSIGRSSYTIRVSTAPASRLFNVSI